MARHLSDAPRSGSSEMFRFLLILRSSGAKQVRQVPSSLGFRGKVGDTVRSGEIS